MATRNIFQQLAEQIRSLKTENEELKRNSNGGKSYIKQLFQMTIKNMKLKVEHSKSAFCAIKFKEENDILKEKNMELENRIKEYEESMEQLTDLLGEPPSIEEEPIIACNPTKIQSIIRGFLMRKKELLKCGICYETHCDHAKVKTQCCKNIICKGCFQRCSHRCPFCRNNVEYRNSIPFNWWDTDMTRWYMVGMNDGQIVIHGRPLHYHGGFNVPFGNCPDEWKLTLRIGGWYSKYCEFIKQSTLNHPNHNWERTQYPMQQFPNETDDALIRKGVHLRFNRGTPNEKYFRIIEGNSMGIYEAFKKVCPIPSRLTTANPRTDDAKIEIVKFLNYELTPMVGDLYGVGRARGFNYARCQAYLERKQWGVRNAITNESCKGQTKESKWNRAFLRLVCGEWDDCHPYHANNTQHNYNICYFIIKIQHVYTMFLINHTQNQDAREYQRTRNNDYWFVSPSVHF